MTKEKTVDPLQAFDQLQAHASNVVVLIAEYYYDLIEKKIPPDLAFKLTVDFQMFLWSIGNNK